MSGKEGGFGPDEIAEIIRMQQREEASSGGKQQQPRGVNIKARTFAKPVKPIFEGKSVADVMQRRGSDSTTNSEKLAELEADEVSLSSVQNLQTIPSVSEGPGLFGMLANFRIGPSSKSKSTDDSHRIGELPNKAKLQHADTSVQKVELMQNSGSLATADSDKSHSGGRKLSFLSRGSTSHTGSGSVSIESNSERANRAQSMSDFPILSSPSKQRAFTDDDFFAAMDGNRPASMSNLSVDESGDAAALKAQKARDRRAQRGNVKPKHREHHRSVSSSDIEATSTSEATPIGRTPLHAPTSTEPDGWMPIVAPGTTIQSRAPARYSIDESEHSLSSIAAMRKPLAKETLMAQALAKKQQEELAALMADAMANMETMDELESDDSIETSHQNDLTNQHDWQDVAGVAYEKKTAKPLALSVDEEDDTDDDDVGLRPKSRELQLQKVEEMLRKQEEQLRDVVKATPEVDDALQETEVLSRKERKETRTVNGEWHDVNGDKAESHAKILRKGREFFEDPEEDDLLARPASRDARKLEEAARKQRSQVINAIQETPDAKGALKVTKVLSKREKKSMKKTKDEWQEVEPDSAKPPSSRLDKSRDSMEDDEDDKLKMKSKFARSLAETTRRQQELVDDAILDAPDVEGALGKPGVFDHGEREEIRKTRREWHEVDDDKERVHAKAVDNNGKFYPERAAADVDETKATQKVKPASQQTPKSPKKDDSKPSKPRSTKSKSPTRSNVVGPTSAYPVDDRPPFDADGDPESTKPVLLMKQKVAVYDTAGSLVSVPDELEPIDTGKKQDWHGVDHGRHPSDSKGSYTQKNESPNANASIQAQNESPEKEEASNKQREERAESIDTQKKQDWHGVDPGRHPSDSKSLYTMKNENPDADSSKKSPSASSGAHSEQGTGPIDKGMKQDWRGIDPGRHRSDSKGLYTQKTETPDTKSTNRSQSSSSKKEQTSKKPGEKESGDRKSESNPSKKSSYKPSKQATKNNAKESSRPPRSRGDSGSKKAQAKKKNANFGWERVSTHSRQDSVRKITATTSEGSAKDAPILEIEKAQTFQDGEINGKQSFQTPSDSEAINILPTDGPSDPESSLAQNSATPFDARPNLSPFDYRPEATPFAFRPEVSVEVKGQEEDAPDDITTQSVDRHIVRETSRRSLLRKKVTDRREALAHMLQSSQEITLNTEHEILDLKRKLALSQALVQRLEIENSELERKALLDFSVAQIQLLRQRDKREKELEAKLKKVMEERNAAVMECHELRLLITQSCEACRKRFDNQRQYIMDYSIRNTILEKEKSRKSSAFEWLTAGLAEETGSVKSEPDLELARARFPDFDAMSMDTTLPDSNMIHTGTSFQFVPLQWLSSKLGTSTSRVADIPENHAVDSRPQVISYENQPEEVAGTRSKSEGNEVDSTTDYGGLDPEERNETSLAPTDGVAKSSDGLLDHGTSTTAAGDGEEKTSQNMASTTSAERMPVLSTSAHEKAVSTRSQKTFLSNLLPEKVQDEFATITASSAHNAKSSKASGPKKSFFSSLFGERVDEDATFANIDAARLAKVQPDSSPQKKSKFGLGLKGEQVLDDMEILNSIMSISQDKTEPAAKPKRIGLSSEQFNDEEYDQRLLSALAGGNAKSANQSPDRAAGGSTMNSYDAKKKGLMALRSEKFDDDGHDAKLLSLLKEGDAKATTSGQSPNLGTKPPKTFQSGLSPLSKIASPFTTLEASPRKRVSTINKGRRGASTSVSYLGRFSITAEGRDGLDALPFGQPSSPNPHQENPSSVIPVNRMSMMNHVPVDVELEGERPWKKDRGSRPISKLSLLKEDDLPNDSLHSQESNHSDHIDEDEDLDHIAALMAMEGS